MLLKPRFGIRMWSGIWPPSKPKTETPERLFWPFWPRPAVLPSPEPMPRPTRTRLLRAPLLSLISFSFIFVHSLSLLSRMGTWCSVSPFLSWSGTPKYGVPGRRRLTFDAHHMPDGADHAADLGAVLELDRLVHLVEAEALQRRPLVVGAADGGAGLGDLDLGHVPYSTTASASAEASAALATPSRRAIRSAILRPRRWATDFGLV